MQTRSRTRWWLAVPSGILLAVVLIIWATDYETLMANNPALPISLVLAGVLAVALLVVAVRPRR